MKHIDRELSVQVVAFHTLIVSLCSHLARVSPSAIDAAFDEAVGLTESCGFLLGKSDAHRYFLESARVIEALRGGALRS